MRAVLFIALILPLAACGGSAEKTDLAKAGKARSLLAEAGLNRELAPRTTAAWSTEMRQAADAQLAALATEARSSGGPDGPAIADIVTLPPNPGAALLQTRAAEAQAIEQRIEARLEAR